ncbi:hypothetical protein ABW20_dc0101326 [Dactylellina cionopaga]|nr:hypothetical protein ABW20_dc0101326 [Dactylellina cionopaga]
MPQQSSMKRSLVSVTVAIIAFVPSISGHCLFTSATGDYTYSNGAGEWKGWTRGLGFRNEVDGLGRKHGYMFPNQWDVATFATSVMTWDKPVCTYGEGGKCCAKNTCWPAAYYTAPKQPRAYVSSGCGITVHNLLAKVEGAEPSYSSESQDQGWERQVKYYQQWAPTEAYVDVNWEIWQQVQRKELTQATAGGYLKMNLHQVNDDGAGPFRCKLDMTGTAKRGDRGWDASSVSKADSDWDGWLTVNQTGVLQGDPSYEKERGKSLGPIKQPTNYIMSVDLPANLDCTGTLKASDGTVVQKDLCLIRCENEARNGPFGGCMYFQQFRLPKKPTKPYTRKPFPKPPKPTKISVPDDYVDKAEPKVASDLPYGYNKKRDLKNAEARKLRFKRD